MNRSPTRTDPTACSHRLYPPMTYIEPTGRKETVTIDGTGVEGKVTITVLELVPHIGS